MPSTASRPFGEIMTVAAQVRGIAALVTSGSVRDRDAIAALDACEVFGFAVHARGTVPSTARGRIGTQPQRALPAQRFACVSRSTHSCFASAPAMPVRSEDHLPCIASNHAADQVLPHQSVMKGSSRFCDLLQELSS